MVVSTPRETVQMRNGDVEVASLECLKEWAGLQESSEDSNHQSGSRELMRLSRTIEGEIIPRLMMLLKPEIVEVDQSQNAPTDDSPLYSIEELVQLLLRHDATVAYRYVNALRSGGMALPAIYLDLLAPAARLLGVMWENDECNFTQVTLAVSRMHQVLLQFSPCFCASVATGNETGNTALIVPIPGEQHTFGLFMVTEFFRRAGWNIWSGNPATDDELLGVVRRNSFDLVGYSVAADRQLVRLPEQIRAIRKASMNRTIKVMVGGRAFTDNPDLYREVGADATATDGMDAVKLAAVIVKSR